MKIHFIALVAFFSFVTVSDAADLRVMSFNIRFGTANDGENHWDKRREFVAETIARFDPDLLGTQETLEFQKEFLSKKLPKYTSFGVGREDGGQAGEMTAIFYKTDRFECVDQGHFWLSEMPQVVGSKSWDSSLPRMASWVKLRDRSGTPVSGKSKRPIFFINTHFDHIGKQAREESARILIEKSAELGDECDVIITGDFNAAAESIPHRTLFTNDKLPLTDTYAKAAPKDSRGEATFSGFNADVFDGNRIDWIAVSKNWRIESASIDRTAKEGRTPSDHYPVTAVVSQKADRMGRIRVSDDGEHFVVGPANEKFTLWGVNYDHDADGRLLEEYWFDEWETVENDFSEIKALGANCVRIHLQFGLFIDSPEKPNQKSLEQLRKLVSLAESTGVYLDITGLACYHKKHIPEWYDALNEAERWRAQALFWNEVTKACNASQAVFCFDLMNEPVMPAAEPTREWLLGELGGKFFVQRISLDLAGRSREQVAEAWIRQMTDAIREHDKETLVTVGVIPWVHVFGAGKPLFHDPKIGKPLDFVSVHFYPKKGEVDKAISALRAYEVGKPIVVEEMFPLNCSEDELIQFVEESSVVADGWISFYWGRTSEELRSAHPPTLGTALTASWLDRFKKISEKLIITTPSQL